MQETKILRLSCMDRADLERWCLERRVNQHADKLNSKFGIEAPNENAIALHLKLGHIKAEGDSYFGVKCFLVQSF